LSLAKGVHQFLQSGGALDLEEDLIVVIGDFNVEMLTLATGLSLLGGARASVVVGSRHVVQKEGEWTAIRGVGVNKATACLSNGLSSRSWRMA